MQKLSNEFEIAGERVLHSFYDVYISFYDIHSIQAKQTVFSYFNCKVCDVQFACCVIFNCKYQPRGRKTQPRNQFSSNSNAGFIIVVLTVMQGINQP